MQTKFRQIAEERLKTGTAPATRGLPVGADALRLLYDLASAPHTAGDAHKLLHELQVHQVELDMQCEQAEQERQQVEEQLKTLTMLFALAPFGYVNLDDEGRLLAVNRIAAEWFAPSSEAMSRSLLNRWW